MGMSQTAIQDSNGWQEILPALPPPRQLESGARYRTVVIGGGVTGISAARRLGELRPGERIALIEGDRVGDGPSGRNAGFMLNMHSHGKPKNLTLLKRNIQIWTAGLEDLRKVVQNHQIQCGWNDDGRLYAAAGPDGQKHVDALADTLRRLDLPFEIREQDRLRADLGTTFYQRAVHAPGNALVNPAQMMRGLATALPANVDLFEATRVRRLHRTGGGFRIETSGGDITTEQVVVAAGVMMQELGIAKGRYVSVATYASLTKPLSDAHMAELNGSEGFGVLASSNNGATVRLTRDRRIFFRNMSHFAPGGTNSVTQATKAAALHRQGILNRWPSFTDVEIEYSWGGAIPFTGNDGAVFGEMEPGLFAVLSNDVGPMTRGAASGRLIAELIEGQDSDLLSLMMDTPMAKRMPPRPFLDLGIAWTLHKIRRAGVGEF